jgi:photosystem II stability/assembly factor-like uncharacterized protein
MVAVCGRRQNHKGAQGEAVSKMTQNTVIFYLATSNGPIIVTRLGDRPRADRPLDVRSASCIAADPFRPEHVFCTTARQGVWHSDNAGATWRRVFEGVPYDRVTSLAVSGAERINGLGVVYVGTEPSAVFRSENGGATWHECSGLSDLPSSSEWSFPPRPETHHVRWIEPDPHEAGRLYVAIEAGALVRSFDGGATWHDRVPSGPRDTHQLATYPNAPGRLWSAAGDGFFASNDGGDSWRKSEQGLRFRYCWSVAVDPADPEMVVLSAAPGPQQAHTPEHAESAIYRRTGVGPWQEVRAGLPPSKGTLAAAVAANPSEPGVFYAAADAGLYRSSDGGATWQRLDVEWPDRHGGARVHVIAAVRLPS